MAKLTPEAFQKLSHLARLRFEPQEAEAFQEQLNKVLTYVEKLQEVDIDGIEPMSHVQQLDTVMREDEPLPSGIRDEALKNAPDKEGPFFKVPQFVGE